MVKMKRFLVVFFIFPAILLAQVWTARYNGPGNNRDESYAIILDSSYNVYITGWSPRNYGWNYDYCTIKYNSSGVEQWVARYNGTGDTIDQARAIGLDESLNVYVTGRSWDWTTNNDIVTIKYNNQGDEQWVKRYNGSANNDDQAYAMAVSPQGNVYVGGYCTGAGTYWDYFLIKYDTQGESLWVATYNGTGNSNDAIYALTIDSVENCYVTGYSFGETTDYDIVTIKYNPDGETVWVTRYDGPVHGLDRGVDIALNRSGEVWVTGASMDSADQQDFVNVHYNSNGAPQWAERYHGPGIGTDRACAIAIDTSNNSYITGTSIGANGTSDIVTIKYDSDGYEQWIARYDGLANYIDVATDIALDRFSNVCVSGYSQNIVTSNDYVTIKYNPDGDTCWVVVFDNNVNLDDETHAITTDDSGYVYVTGYSMGVNSFRDYFTIKYYQGGVSGMQQTNTETFIESRPVIFPNPAKNLINVISPIPVKLFDVTGKLITTLKPGTNMIKNLPKGIYFTNINNNKLSKLVILDNTR